MSPVRRGLSLLAALLSVTFVALPAAASGDAGSGGDAPDSRAMAMPVGAGVLAGHAEENDVDWYQVTPPAGHGVRVAYSASVPGTWNAVRLYEGNGEGLGYARPGETAALVPSGGVVLIEVSGFWDEMDYTLGITLFAAPPQDDAGTGGDAGNAPAYATPVPPGPIEGAIDPDNGDPRDWFRVTHAADELLELTFRGYASVALLDGQGRDLGFLYGWDGASTSIVSPDGILVLGMYGDLDYDGDVVRAKRADLGVLGLSVAARPLETDAGPLPLATQREVTVEVDNAGPGASRGAHLLLYSSQDGLHTAPRVVADVPVSLAAGGRGSWTFPWDTLGQAGEATLRAVVVNEHELAPADNEASVRTFNLVGGTVLGVDLLNQRASADPSALGAGAHVVAGAEYGAHGRGIYAQAWPRSFSYSPQGLYAGTDAEGNVRLDAAVCLVLCLSV